MKQALLSKLILIYISCSFLNITNISCDREDESLSRIFPPVPIRNNPYLSVLRPDEQNPSYFNNKKNPTSSNKPLNSYLSIPIDAAKQLVKAHDHYGYFYCPKENEIECTENNYTYRTIDGTCNNLKYKWWGRSNSPYKRLGIANYENLKNQTKITGKSGTSLPGPRDIAIKIHRSEDHYGEASHFFVIYAQFFAHDLISSKPGLVDNGKDEPCSCDSENNMCIKIPIPAYDYTYHEKRDCLLQIRHASADGQFKCNFEYREQMNSATSYMDLNTIYGNDLKTSKLLRTFVDGKLATSVSSVADHNEKFPPSLCKLFPKEFPDNICLISGDNRVNLYPILSAIHTIWLREHNRVCDVLKKLDPLWTDEKLYNEARTIVIAEYQNILMQELFPAILSKHMCEIFDLKTQKNGYFYGYDENVFTNVDNEASIALRFGHVMARGTNSFMDENYDYVDKISIHDATFKPSLIFSQDGLASVIRGSLFDKAYQFKKFMTSELLNRVVDDFKLHPKGEGNSLATWNIMRTREHGIESYNYYRQLAGLNKAKSFKDLTHISEENIKELESIYQSVDDIDFWTGCVNEQPVPGGLVGPTMAYIIARTIRTAKIGDRHYFENGHDEKLRLSEAKLKQLRKASLARILCDNVNIAEVPINPFFVYNKQKNPIVDCEKIPRLSLNVWLTD